LDHTLTTGNDLQTVSIADGSTASAADVGFDPPAGGDISGHVFSDVDGNGIEDGSDIGLASVEVSITDFEGAVQTATTDSNGDFFVAGLAPGNAGVTWTTPVNYTLTTGNDSQTIEVLATSRPPAISPRSPGSWATTRSIPERPKTSGSR
jgi:hypothetical protein